MATTYYYLVQMGSSSFPCFVWSCSIQAQHLFTTCSCLLFLSFTALVISSGWITNKIKQELTQGHESHGVHVCHKCGWPFQNLHPSAKQRRAHKKICGTVEGYKLFLSEGQTHSNASDDEHLSGPNALDTSTNEKGSGGIREKSTRSENEVFSNAVADFSDGGQSPGIKETLQDSLEPDTDLEIVHRKYEEFSRSSEGNSSNAADVNHLIVRSRDDGQLQNHKILQSERVVDGNIVELQVQLSGSNVDRLSSYIADLRTEESTVPHSDDCFGLSSDSNSSKAEATSNVLLENKIYAGENVGDCSLTSVAKETSLKGEDQIKSDIDMIEIVAPSDNTADGALNLKEKKSAEFLSVRPQNNLPLEVNSTVSTNASTNGIQVESAHLIQFPASSDVKTLQERGEGNVNVSTLPSCDDRPDVAHPQNEHEDYKDHEGVVSQNSLSLHSSEALKQELDDLKDSVTEENNVLINQSQLSEKKEALSPDMNILDRTMKKEQVSCELMAEEMHAKESIEVSSVELMVESDKKLDEIEDSRNAMKTEMNESHTVHFSEEQVSDGVHCNSQQISLPEGSFMATSNENPVYASFGSATIETTRVISIDNKGSPSGAQKDIKDDEINSNGRVNEECNRFVGTSADSHQAQDAELLVKAAEDLGSNYTSLSSLNTEPSAQCVSAVEGTQDGEPGRELSGITAVPVQDQSGNNGVKLASSAIYTSVDSDSQCDCLEANCGSLSVLSMQSDVQAVTNAEALPSTGLLASTEESESNLEDPKAASERQQCEKPEMFEPPSFMTLVEPGHVVGPKADAPEVQKEPNQHHLNCTSLQAGWFPTLTHVTNESQGRKRNEEIIAKVTNLSTSKQHTPLKSLFGEAAHSSKPKSPKSDGNIVNQKNDEVSEDNGSGLTTVNSILGLESPAAQAMKREGGKEWNSPARYPANIKREKKKVNIKEWIQFVCCSSVDPQER